MKLSTLALSALVAVTGLAGTSARADNMASIAITPATGVVTLAPRWSIASGLAGFHQKAQDLGIGGAANNFYSIKAAAIPAGGDILAFNYYVAGSGAATPHADIGSKLTPNSYSALTSADPDVGFGSVHLYLIHHKGTTDYFTHITPGSGTSSAVTDLKPMSGPGGPATVTGVSGYFGLTFAASNLGYGLNMFYYLRTDPVTGFTKFGTLAPALLSASADQFDLGISGHNALAFTGTDVGYGTDKMYYLRLDPVTGFTILGTLHPVSGRASDIANLGSVYSTLTFVPGDVGFGSGQFYTTGSVNPTWQSVSFAAINDRAISAGSFTVSPSASSALPIVLTVVPGSIGAATISGPVNGVFTVTPTQPGLITLQASQAGQSAPTAFEANMLRQSFTASGTGFPVVTNSTLTAAGSASAPFNFAITASGSPTSYSASPLPAGLSINTATGVITGTPTTVGTTSVLLGATSAIGTGNATLTITVAAAGAAPIITNNPLTAAGTVGSAFSFTITASGIPTSFAATPLPAGLNLNASTGAITGTPTAVGVTTVVLGATNGSGTGNATLTITVGASGLPPVITNNPLVAAGTVGVPFGYTITASGSPTGYTTGALPAGLSVVAATGVITGTPTATGTTNVTLNATNATGTGSATLSITIGAVAGVPVITSPGTAPGVLGLPFTTYLIAATGLPTSYTASGLPPGLTLNVLTGAITGTPTTAGTYLVTLNATNSAGTSTLVVTMVIDAVASSRIVAFSARSQAGNGNQTLIMGFAVSGNNKTLLMRGLGAGLNLPNALADPQLALFNGSTSLATNDDWATGGNAAQITSLTAQVGLAALPTASKDAALVSTVNNGVYTTRVFGANSATGTAIAEVYDADSNTATRLVAVSARMQVDTGDNILIGGLIIRGNVPKNILIRGVGPGLATFGVTGFLADPQLKVYSGSTVIGTNDNWESGGNAAQLAAVFTQVGEFPLTAGGKDAALLLALPPGAYTVHLSGVSNTTGVALIEIYEAP